MSWPRREVEEVLGTGNSCFLMPWIREALQNSIQAFFFFFPDRTAEIKL